MPSQPPAYLPQIRLYQDWLAEQRGLHFEDYPALWRWSTSELDAFWQSIWDYFELQSPTPHQAVLANNTMPGTVWFPGAQVNYAQQVMRHVAPASAAGMPAIIGDNERGQAQELSWPELKRQVAALALHLKAQGLQAGDRVAAYLPNCPETMVAFLATASLGGVWSVCAPDMGRIAVLDRFGQIEPKLLIGCDRVWHGGREHDRLGVLQALRAALPTVQHLILLPQADQASENVAALAACAPCADWRQLVARDDAEVAAFEPVWLPFDHPLWIVYSSGTTGLPKPIVHGHGGTLLVAMALKVLHNDIGCSYHPNSWGERYFWYSSTGWVMWNAQLSGLLNGTTCVLFDGSPAGPKERPDWGTLWRFAARHRVSFFGAGAAFYGSCMKAGLDLAQLAQAGHGLHRIRALGSTGSPLPAEVQTWGSEQLRHANASNTDASDAQADPAGVWWCNISGGTDFAGAFIGSHRELPQVPGRMQCRLLGCAVEAWNEQGQPVIGEVGELVCVQPIPSMPLCFVGDTNHQRYLGSYFDSYPPGQGRRPGGGDAAPSAGAVWRHGDWLKIDADGGCTIFGRSDATINRHGLRMGTSELYSAIEALPEVLDSMVVDLEYLGRPSHMPLFVVLREGLVLDPSLRERIHQAIKTALSPRFIPDAVWQVAEIPRTLSGKKQELPIKKMLLGQPMEQVINREAMANPACLDWYADFAAQHLAHQAHPA